MVTLEPIGYGGVAGVGTPGADRCVGFYLLGKQCRMPVTFQIWEFQLFILRQEVSGMKNSCITVLWDGTWQQGPKLTLGECQTQVKIGLVTTWLVTVLGTATSFKSNELDSLISIKVEK